MHHQCQLSRASHEYHVTTKHKDDANYFHEIKRNLSDIFPTIENLNNMSAVTQKRCIGSKRCIALPSLWILPPSLAFSHQKSRNLVSSLYRKKLWKIIYVKYKKVKIPNVLRGLETTEVVIRKLFIKLSLAIVNVHLLRLGQTK